MRITSDQPLVLGSASPRRRELIALLGIPVVVRAAHVDESQRARETPDAYLDRISQAKLDAVRSEQSEQVAGILVADTIVVAPDGAVLGKPASDEDANATLERLASATHEVRTRFLLAEGRPGAPLAWGQTVVTRVTFRPLARSEVHAYTATGEGRDKAGGYAIQGRAATFVERIEGSYTNVVGLPLCQLMVAMQALAWC